MNALDAARTHLHQTHGGDTRRAIMAAQRREWIPEGLPRAALASQPGVRAWLAATADDLGIHVLSSGGACVCVAWDRVLQVEGQQLSLEAAT